jgi:peptidoglycan/LPS O-acetylase OafA/YrhL
MPTVAQGGRFGDRASYAIRRAARILPTYWLCVVIVVTVALLYPGLRIPATPTLADVAAHMTLLQSPAVLVDSHFPVGMGLDGALWTISALACFYLILPFIAGTWYRHPFTCLAVAAVITVVWREVATGPLGLHQTGPQLPYWAFHIGVGMTAALLFVRLHERFSSKEMARVAPWLQLGAAVGLVVVLVAFAPHAARANLVIGLWEHDLAVTLAFPVLLAVLMLATALAPRPARLALDSRPLRTLGDASYGAYMIHLPIMIVLWDTLPRDSVLEMAAWFAVVLPPSFAFGYVAFTWLEAPIRRRAREWAVGRQRGKPEPASQIDATGLAAETARVS